MAIATPTPTQTTPSNTGAGNAADVAALKATAPTTAANFGTVAPGSTPSTTGTTNTPQSNPTAIPPSQAFGQTPLAVPTVTTPNPVPGAVAISGQTLAQLQANLTPAPTALDQSQQSLLDQISQVTGEEGANGGKEGDLMNLENAPGANGGPSITAQQSTLQQLQAQLLANTAQYTKNQAAAGGMGGDAESSSELAAQNAGLDKANAATTLMMNATINAVQGNLTLALNQAQMANDAKYDGYADQLNTLSAQLAAIAPQLDAEQKTQALAQQEYIVQQQQAVADAKDTSDQINNVSLQAAQAGATPDQIAAIQSAGTVVDAIAAAAPSLGAAALAKVQQQQFDNTVTLKQLGISQEEADTSRLSEENTANADVNQYITTPSESMTPQEYQTATAQSAAAAAQYQTTGKFPSSVAPSQQAYIAYLAQNMAKTPGQIVDSSTGVASSSITADQETNLAQAYNIVQNIIPQLQTSFTSAAQSGGFWSNPLGNIIPSSTSQGSQDAATYAQTVSQLNAALTLLGSKGIFTGVSAADLPSAGSAQSAGLKQISALASNLNSSLSGYLSANNLSIAGFSPTGVQDTGTASNHNTN